jgi:TRAP-type C4-dicarboxylate transport system substrate-binding protein
MLKKKHGLWVLIVIMMVSLLFAGCSAPADTEEPGDDPGEGEATEESLFDQTYEVRLASEEVEGDPMTHWGKEFAAAMEEWSEGKFNIDVYPYGTIGENRDINELCQLGVVEFVYSCHGWINTFVPEASVVGLHYMWPQEKTVECFDYVMKNGTFMEYLEQAFRREGMVPLGVALHDWQWITSNKPINTVDDMKDLVIRVMGSEMLSASYKAYGSNPTALAYGEIYSGLQTGLIEAQVQPCYAQVSMKFYEVQDYMTLTYGEPFVGIPCINAQFYDSLPEEVQDYMKDWWADALVPLGEWTAERREKELEEIKDDINLVELDEEAIDGFREAAMQSHEDFKNDLGGPLAKEVYDALVKDIEAAKEALGIEK